MAEQIERAPRFEPLSALWRFFAAPQTLLTLLGFLALALATSTFIPQIPADFTGDPQAWRAMQSGVWLQAGSFLHALGLFSIYNSLWFRALLVVLGLCLFVRTVDSTELAWLVTRREGLTPARFFASTAHPPSFQVSAPLPLNETSQRLVAFLFQRGYRTRTFPEVPVPSVVAVRRGLLFWSWPLAYGSLLVALVCAAVVGIWGWQSEPWRPREGEVHEIGHETPYSIRLDAFGIVPGDGTQLAEYSSTITWLEGETVVEQSLVGAGRISSHAGLTLRQAGYVPMVRMRGWDSDDVPLMLETEGDVLSMTGEAEIRFASSADQPLVLVPNEDLFLMLSFEKGCDGGGPALQVHRIGEGGDDLEALGTLDESGVVFVDGLQFEVELALVPILRVSRYPAAGLALAGLILFIIALASSWLASPRLLWIAMAEEQEDNSLIRILALGGAGPHRWLSQLTGLFQEVLRADA
ncbi:MAG: cytochrome c biogenesis protein ResB [Anaerolineae bacterium]